jgi:hypothetical protein
MDPLTGPSADGSSAGRMFGFNFSSRLKSQKYTYRNHTPQNPKKKAQLFQMPT